jgi:hypothetical protein
VLSGALLSPTNNPISAWYSSYRILTSVVPTYTPAALFMAPVPYCIRNSLSEPIDRKQKSRISNSLNTFLCFYSIKGIIDCFYYTLSLAFLLTTISYCFIFNSNFSLLLSFLPFFLHFSSRAILQQGDQKLSVHLMITVQKTNKNILNMFNHLP